MLLSLQIKKVENGYIITVSGDANWNSRDCHFVFNSWEAASGFLSSLNEKYK